MTEENLLGTRRRQRSLLDFFEDPTDDTAESDEEGNLADPEEDEDDDTE